MPIDYRGIERKKAHTKQLEENKEARNLYHYLLNIRQYLYLSKISTDCGMPSYYLSNFADGKNRLPDGDVTKVINFIVTHFHVSSYSELTQKK